MALYVYIRCRIRQTEAQAPLLQRIGGKKDEQE
jgi:hypothetical protein